LSDKQRIGIVGNGDAAKSVVRSFSKHPDVELVGAADPEPRARKRFEDDFGAMTFASIEELLDAGNLDGIYIATPTKLHESFVTKSLEAGVHVLVEKPVAPSIAATTTMISPRQREGTVSPRQPQAQRRRTDLDDVSDHPERATWSCTCGAPVALYGLVLSPTR
jgi:predicted dehydrogenase